MPDRPTEMADIPPGCQNVRMLIFLETERLLLPQFTVRDSDLILELDSDPRVMRYITRGAPTARDLVEDEVLPAFLGYYRKFPATVSGPRPRSHLEISSAGYTTDPPPAIHPISRNWATGCAARRGERDTRPRVHVR